MPIDFGTILTWVGIVVGFIIVIAAIFFILAFGKLWIQAYSSGCPIATVSRPSRPCARSIRPRRW